MYGLALTAFLALAGQASDVSAGALTGRYVCRYMGNWGCSDGGCVDSPRPLHARHYTLHVDFDEGRIRLNGIEGRLEAQQDGRGYSVFWHVSGIGQPRLTSARHDGRLIVSLTHSVPASASGTPAGSSVSDFDCSSEARSG